MRENFPIKYEYFREKLIEKESVCEINFSITDNEDYQDIWMGYCDEHKLYWFSRMKGAEENGYDIPLVAFDTHDAVKEYMMRGIVTAAISQNVKKQMQLAFDTLAKHIINGDESEKTIYTGPQLALKSNISQFD